LEIFMAHLKTTLKEKMGLKNKKSSLRKIK
jgi:hypothetical protein